MKKNVIIYGLGKRYYDLDFRRFILPEIIIRYNVIGICDKKKTTINNDIFKWVEKESLRDSDLIIVTSSRYHDEIKSELCNRWDVESEKVIPLSEIESEIFRERFRSDLFTGLNGVEVGGPSPLFESSIYKEAGSIDGVNYSKDTVWSTNQENEYVINGRYLGKLIIADATNISVVNDNSYDFYISSNNLEHIANPIKAIYEARRIIRKDGYILIVVPDKEVCFDHRREDTEFIHLFEDYMNSVKEDDLTHLDEIVNLHDYDMDSGVITPEEFKERALNNIDNRCLHHHVFSEEMLRMLFRLVSLEIICSGKFFGGFYILGKR